MKPNVSYLRVFGCVAYYHIPKEKRGKLELPGKIGIMIGYSRERRGYRIYDPEKEQVLEERSVRFNEKKLGKNYVKRNSYDENYNCEYDNIIPDNEQETNIGVEEEEVMRENEDIEDYKSDDSHQTIEESNEDSCNESNRISRLRGRPRGTLKEVMESRDRLRKIQLQEKDD